MNTRAQCLTATPSKAIKNYERSLTTGINVIPKKASGNM
jgi:hypothetical protein